uniref:Uncharacterized protein n=1 Tax=Gopherus agassizii TaxID=38772 RepID=A0A452GP27_9SAUR
MLCSWYRLRNGQLFVAVNRLLKRFLRVCLRLFRKTSCGQWMTYFLFFSMWCYEPGELFFKAAKNILPISKRF